MRKYAHQEELDSSIHPLDEKGVERWVKRLETGFLLVGAVDDILTDEEREDIYWFFSRHDLGGIRRGV